MDVFLGEWVNLLLRWAHMVVGIGWIGTSFYFMALDYSLDTKERKSEGVYGTHGRCTAAASITSRNSPWRRRSCPASALVHVGGLSHLGDRLRPAHRPVLPARRSYLIDPAVHAAGAMAGDRDLGRLARSAAGPIYDGLCRSPHRPAHGAACGTWCSR